MSTIMEYRFVTCDVFADRPFSGNPLAVFPSAKGLCTEAMQSIAREFNLSETTFVLPPRAREADFRVKIFTPTQELPFAGHPTIGTAFVLAWTGSVPPEEMTSVLVLEEEAGLVPVTFDTSDGLPVQAEFAVPALPVKKDVAPSRSAVASALSLAPEEMLTGIDQHEVWHCGTPCLCVPLRGREAVARACPDLGVWEDAFSDTPVAGAYVFAYGRQRSGNNVHARFFAPGLGIPEDPATGGAASALGGYLGSRCTDDGGIHRWTIEQGKEMGRPSEIHLTVEREDGVVKAVRVGGRAVRMSEGHLEAESFGVHSEGELE